MKTYGYFMVGAALVLLVVVTWWLKEEEIPATSTEVEQVNVEGVGQPEGKTPVSGVDTLKALTLQGKSLECQVVFERGEAEGSIEGTYFTDKGKLRGDFMVPTPEFGGKIISSMIVDTDMLFVWTTIEGQTLGFKSDLTTRDASVGTKEPVSLDQPIKYTCTEWTDVDGSVFIPPTNVTFVDTETSLKAGMEYGTLPE